MKEPLFFLSHPLEGLPSSSLAFIFKSGWQNPTPDEQLPDNMRTPSYQEKVVSLQVLARGHDLKVPC